MGSKLFLLGGANFLLGAYLTTNLSGIGNHEEAASVLLRNTPAVSRKAQVGVDTLRDRQEVRIGRLFEKVADPPAAMGPAQVKNASLDRPRLVGVLAKLDQDPQSSMAVLAFGSAGTSHHLKAGEEQDGWRLVAIRRTEVDVQDRDGRVLSLPLQAR